MCYLVNVKDCTDVNDNPYYGCYLRVGGQRVGYKLAPLAVLGGGNKSQEIWFDSVHSVTATKSVCFYNVSVTDGTTSNCSGVVLESGNSSSQSLGEAEEEKNSTEADSDSCRSYVRIYYTTEESGQQERDVCLRDLPRFSTSIPGVTSVFVVYWTNNDANNRGASFQMRARCTD